MFALRTRGIKSYDAAIEKQSWKINKFSASRGLQFNLLIVVRHCEPIIYRKARGNLRACYEYMKITNWWLRNTYAFLILLHVLNVAGSKSFKHSLSITSLSITFC